MADRMDWKTAARAFRAGVLLPGVMLAADPGREQETAPPDEQQPIKFSYGGQAVMEGVMMRGAYNVAVAVRDPEGKIVVEEREINSALYRGPVSKIPFLRGLTLLWDSLGLGTRALMWSADVALGEEEEINFNGPLGYGTVLVSLAFGIGLFFLLPAAAAGGIERLFGLQHSELLTNIIEGIIRLLLIVGYIYAIGRMKDIARIFQYHGAEHKTINAYEAGAPLTPASVKRFPLEHPRCGTGFILVVAVISIMVFSLLGRPPLVWLLLSRVVLIPVIAGIAYEYIKFTAARMDRPWVRAMVAPSLALQKLTTNEPTEDMLEVSITALKRVLETEKLHRPGVVPVQEEVPAAAH
ncbi:MAG: DUF1385 domain-containing protein [Anaerolineae bacterium]